MMLAILLVAAGSFQCTSEQARRAERREQFRARWLKRPSYLCKIMPLYAEDRADSGVCAKFDQDIFYMPLEWMRVSLRYDNVNDTGFVEASHLVQYALNCDGDTIRVTDTGETLWIGDPALERFFLTCKPTTVDRLFKSDSYHSIPRATFYILMMPDTNLAPVVEALRTIPGVKAAIRCNAGEANIDIGSE
jgi:hypothetical protein